MNRLKHVLQKQNSAYDCVLMLSGGKDSVLALHNLIVLYDLRVLTVTYDDGFLSDVAKKNIDVVTRRFNVDNFTLKHNMRSYVDKFLESELVKTVDINTFIEVFQNIFWEKVNDISVLFGGIPVVTGNIGYFSSENSLEEQCQSSKTFIQSLGLQIPQTDCVFISYWAEEGYTKDFEILKELGWTSEDELSTENSYIKNIRARLNSLYPKTTLDDVIEENWEKLTKPRFL
jgi:NH3-dependent NAD+ synthetase